MMMMKKRRLTAAVLAGGLVPDHEDGGHEEEGGSEGHHEEGDAHGVLLGVELHSDVAPRLVVGFVHQGCRVSAGLVTNPILFCTLE